MTSVWYIGSSAVRSISRSAWTSAGFPGSDERTWSEGNGWSIPTTAFTSAQLDYLATQPDFDTAAPDGPRPSPGDAYWVTPNTTPATEAYVDSRVASAFADISAAVDEGVAAGVAEGLADTLVRDKNLADLPSPADARSNLGFPPGMPDTWDAEEASVDPVLLFENSMV